MDPVWCARMDPVRGTYGSSTGTLMDNRDTYGYSAGAHMDPVRGHVCIQYRDAYGFSTWSLMDLVQGLLWITGALMDKCGGAYGSSTGIRMHPIRDHVWIQ